MVEPDGDADAEIDAADGDAGTDTAAQRCGGSAARWDSEDSSCSEPGCLRWVRFIGDYAREKLEPLLEPGVAIDNGYTVVTLEYVTGDRTSLATVTIPYPCAPPQDGYAVVANAHGTVGLDDACQLTGTTYGTGLAGLFGARGTVGVAPDYPGLGTDALLPYLVSEVEGAAVLDALRATRELMRRIGEPVSRYAVVGLSEGGHAAIAAAALHRTYAPELDIRAFGASGPASVFESQWQQGARFDGPHIAYHAMLMYAWQSYYQADSRIWQDSIGSQIDSIMTNDCSFDFGGTRTTYQDALGESASEIFDSEFIAAYRTGRLAEVAPALSAAFATNALGPYEQTAPLAIWQGEADSTVLVEYTDELVEGLRQGGVEVDYRKVSGADHLDTAFGFLAQHQSATEDSVAFILERLGDSPSP